MLHVLLPANGGNVHNLL